ncbi:MAG: hypothetical protein PHP14_02990 [Candidatus Pacebacteria bacterium]|nr:hypothetical protein [Candidatus Paceibacterota bacterium]
MTSLNNEGVSTGINLARSIESIYESIDLFFGIQVPDNAPGGSFTSTIYFMGQTKSLP